MGDHRPGENKAMLKGAATLPIQPGLRSSTSARDLICLVDTQPEVGKTTRLRPATCRSW